MFRALGSRCYEGPGDQGSGILWWHAAYLVENEQRKAGQSGPILWSAFVWGMGLNVCCKSFTVQASYTGLLGIGLRVAVAEKQMSQS